MVGYEKRNSPLGSGKVALPILGSAQIPQRLIAHSQIPKVGIWAALLKSGYAFRNLICNFC